MNALNLYFFYFINGAAGQYYALDIAQLIVTSYVTYGVIIAIGVYMFFWLPRQASSITGWVTAQRRGLEFLITVITTLATVHLIKALVAAPRPIATLVDIIVLSPYEKGYSFPSGHAALTWAVATTVYFYHKRLGILLYTFAILISISRIYIGVHYPLDIVCGAFLGASLAMAVHAIVISKRSNP